MSRDGHAHERVHYTVTKNTSYCSRGALVDCGANGGIIGSDARIISRTERVVDVSRIDNHEMVVLPIGTCGAVAQSHSGPVIVILHQYALHGHGKSIHSFGQLEAYKNVDDCSLKVGGKQCIRTIDGYCFPIDIINGLAFTPMKPFTDEEYNILPHVIWTSEVEWDPKTLDTIVSDKPDLYNILDDLDQQR